MTDSTQSYVDLYTEVRVRQLREIIEWLMLRYPHAPPAPATVEMFTSGLLSSVDVSNNRPARYCSEPWMDRSCWYHLRHCLVHVVRAILAKLGLCPWLSDDGTPEIAHAVVRGMMCLYQYGKEQKK